MAVDPEMELLEKQLQQSVDTLSTLLEKKERGGEKKEEEEGGEKEEGESGSEGEDDQSEGDFLERRRPPSLSDQMSLLSPGAQRLTARDLSPESALEGSTNSIPNPDPPAGPPSAEGTTPDNAHPPSTPFSSSSRRVVTSTSSSPGAPLLEERGSRPRSRSCDSQRRFGGPLSSSPREKPLMIPSSIPPWLEMVGTCTVTHRIFRVAKKLFQGSVEASKVASLLQLNPENTACYCSYRVRGGFPLLYHGVYAKQSIWRKCLALFNYYQNPDVVC